ncbi:hypothetical protein [Bradyrhizobium liaoningense]|uniref:hypothetical protein n=1 Tax=Bradyrhizobium liaoningense TaxID=43992 RepID=UPI00054DE5B4|nr:hypothetical protein [Bradyrhizobium liaoningense]
MKWTIEQYGQLASVQLDELDHDLWDLWKKCKAILQSAPDSDGDALRVVEGIVKELHDVDKGAIAFRYSRNRNGKTVLLPDKPIDLQNMQRVMESIDNFFKGADGMLSNVMR